MPKPLQSLSWSPVIAVTRQHPESLSVSRRLLSPSHQRPAASMSLTPLLLLLLLVTMLLTSIPTTQANKGVYGGDYCDTEVFRAECAEGEVIIIRKALYGRLKVGRCVEIDMGYIPCFSDVLLAADRRCSGKRVCEIRVPDAEFESTRPCLKELKTYLEASYECVQVETVTTEYCKANDVLNVTSLTSGYIASVMTSDTPYCDGSSHPWMVAGRPGQTINLTLYDFAVENPLGTGQRHPDTPASVDQPAATAATATYEPAGDEVCVQYGLVEDSGLSSVDDDGVKPVAICSDGRRRIQHVYQSVGNVVKIWITAGVAPTDLKRFVIYYRVTGCANPQVPAQAWFTRTADGHGLMGCQHSSDTTPFLCVDGVWRGSFINCSAYHKHITVNVDLPPYDKHFHDDAQHNGGHDRVGSKAILIGVVIGALIAVACIVSLVIIIKLRSQRRQHQPKQDERHTALLRKTTKDGSGGGGSIKMSECAVDKRAARSPLANGSPAAEPLMTDDGRSTSVNLGRSTWQPQLTPVDAVTTSTCSTFKKPPSLAV